MLWMPLTRYVAGRNCEAVWTPRGIIDLLQLKRPIYRQTAKNGHFGHEEFGWEKTDLAKRLA